MITGTEVEIGMTVETIQQTPSGIEIEVSLTLEMEEVKKKTSKIWDRSKKL